MISVAVSIVISLCLLESAFRIHAYIQDRSLFQHTFDSPPPSVGSSTSSLREIIRPSRHHDIIYELRPDLNCLYKGGRLTTNRYGFRGHDIPLEKKEGTFRILGLGDSIMFGQGVDDDDVYLALLERNLNQDCHERKVEVINTAVPGYNSIMELATLEIKGLQFKPDLVILHFVGNDVKLPNFIQKDRDYWAMDRSFLFDFITGNTADLNGDDALNPSPRRMDGFEGFELNRSRIPPKYRHMVGFDAVIRAMDRLKNLSEEHGFDLLVYGHNAFKEDILQILETLGIEYVDAGEEVDRFLEREHCTAYLGSPLTLSSKDGHLSPIGHELNGSVLYSFILQRYLKTRMANRENGK